MLFSQCEVCPNSLNGMMYKYFILHEKVTEPLLVAPYLCFVQCDYWHKIIAGFLVYFLKLIHIAYIKYINIKYKKIKIYITNIPKQGKLLKTPL